MTRSRTRRAIALCVAALAVQRASSASANGCEVKKSEIKIAIDSAKIDDALSKLGVSRREPDKVRSLYFFDTCDLKLESHHVILRSRASQDGSDGETTAKIRQSDSPQVPSDICEDVECEEDRSATTAATSCSLDRDVATGEIATAVAAGGRIGTLFSAEQLELVGLGKIAPPWDEMRALGPIASRTWKDVDIGSGSAATEVTVEEWTLPGKSKAGLLEVSQRVKRADAQSELDALEATLGKLQIALATEQGPKTRPTLEEISRNPALCPAKSR